MQIPLLVFFRILKKHRGPESDDPGTNLEIGSSLHGRMCVCPVESSGSVFEGPTSVLANSNMPIMVKRHRWRARSRMTLQRQKRCFTDLILPQQEGRNSPDAPSIKTFANSAPLTTGVIQLPGTRAVAVAAAPLKSIKDSGRYLAISGNVLLMHFSVFFMRDEFCRRKNGRKSRRTRSL